MILNQKLLGNLHLVFGSLFDEIAAQAETAFTLDQRIEACRRWPTDSLPGDLEELEAMQRERDTEDYSAPATWYGVIRNWQSMTEAEAVGSFNTTWHPPYGEYSQEELKVFYAFLKAHPLPELTEQEKTDMYDRRIRPACLTDLFHSMNVAGFTTIFEDTYDYNHSEPWTVCRDDFDKIRMALAEIRGDALESFFLTTASVIYEKSPQPGVALANQATTLDLLNRFKAMSLEAFQKEIQRVFGNSAEPRIIASLHEYIKTVPEQEPTPEEVQDLIGGILPVFLRPFYMSLPPEESWLLGEYFSAINVYDTFTHRGEREHALEWVVTKGRWDLDFRAWLLAELHKPIEPRPLPPIEWSDYGLPEPKTTELEALEEKAAGKDAIQAKQA